MKHLIIALYLLLVVGCQEEQVLLPKEEVPLSFFYPEGSTFSIDHAGSVKELIEQVAKQERVQIEFVDFEDFTTKLKLSDITWRTLFEVALYSEPIGYTYIEGKKIIKIMPIRRVLDIPLSQIAVQPIYIEPQEVVERLLPLADFAANETIENDEKRGLVVFTMRPSRISKVIEILNRIDKPSPTSRSSQFLSRSALQS